MPSDRRASSSASNQQGTIKFPSLGHDSNPRYSEDAVADGDYHPPDGSVAGNGDVWQPRRKSSVAWGNAPLPHGARRARVKSLSEALRNINRRRGSVTDNAHELAEALKAPVSLKLVLLCGLWYMVSIFSNASSKSILIAFKFPVTLTVVQFAFVSSLCIFSSWMAHLYPPLQTMIPALRYSIRQPNKELIMTTLPLTAFQIGGHILNSSAMSRIPVSLVHTIKGLSPLFTVLAYRIFYRVKYSYPTYLSLVPLTLGVIMACSANLSGDFVGFMFALGSALLFVTQNIVSKKLFNEADKAESDGVQKASANKKPDKLNLLCYSSGLALIFTLPIWVGSEAPTLLGDLFHNGAIELSKRPDALDHGRLTLEFIFNGVFHFAQSLVAFVLLSMVSPVTYSVASLIKRVFVICFAMVWFGNSVTTIQGSGIGMTFVGLYLYDRNNDAARADRRLKMTQGRPEQPLLPLIAEKMNPAPGSSPRAVAEGRKSPRLAVAAHAGTSESRRDGSVGPGGGRWLPPGTRQEQTWIPHDKPHANGVPV